MSYHTCPMCGSKGSFIAGHTYMSSYYRVCVIDESDMKCCCTIDNIKHETVEEANRAAAEIDLEALDHERMAEADSQRDDGYFWDDSYESVDYDY